MNKTLKMFLDKHWVEEVNLENGADTSELRKQRQRLEKAGFQSQGQDIYYPVQLCPGSDLQVPAFGR